MKKRFSAGQILAVFAVLAFVAFALLPFQKLRSLAHWAPMVFNAPEKMEPAPFLGTGAGGDVQKLSKNHLIAHAGGAVRGYTYTNSLEALNQARERGYRFVEIDLQTLPDGTVVGAHDVPAEKSWTEFSQKKIYGEFTPISGATIAQFFRENPEMILVSDKISKKEDLENFLKTWGENRDNLVVEVFSPRQWLDAKNLGIRYPALCVGGGGWSLRLATFFNIPLATCDRSLLRNCPQAAENYLKSGGSLLVYTENSKGVARQNLSRRATLYYTDYLVPEDAESATSSAEAAPREH